MVEKLSEIAKNNARVDQQLLSKIKSFEDQLPEGAIERRGADYNIAPPLGGQALKRVSQSKPDS